jgi:O-antigen/teichoic acid export membrane protein
LTASGFGLFAFAQAVLLYLLLMIDGGLSLFGIKEIAKDKTKSADIGVNIFSLRFILALLIFLLSALFLVFINISIELKLLLIFTFLMLFSRAITPEWIFQGLERMEFVGISKILQQAFFLGLVLVFVKNLDDLLAVPLLQFLGGLVTSLILLFVLLRYYARFRLRELRPREWTTYFVAAIPLGISSIFIQIYYNLDVIMLGFMQRPEVVGWYNASYRLFFIIFGIVGVFSATSFPVVCKKFNEGKQSATLFLEKYLHLMLLGAFPAVLLALLCSRPAIRLIYGAGYIPGVLAFNILILNILIVAISGVYGGLVLLPRGKNKEFMYSVGMGAFSNLLLNFLLIPPFSLVGAALATLITEIIVAIAFFYWAGMEIQLDWKKYVLKPVLAGGIAFLGTFIILGRLGLNDILFLFSSILLFSSIYILVIIFTKEGRFLSEIIGEIIRTGA